MTATKIRVSEILKSEKYAIRIVNIHQILKLIPDCPILEDMELFFSTDANHSEYIGTTHTIKEGFHLNFVHKENKTIIEFYEVETD